jgi:hypothetical protein
VGLGCDWAYPCSIEVPGLAGEVADERRRRSSGNTAVAVQGLAKEEAWLGKMRHEKL